jgi:hypothetical protein
LGFERHQTMVVKRGRGVVKRQARKVAPQTPSSRVYLLGAVLFALTWIQVAGADTLELRTGQIVQGKFVSGSSRGIRFQVNGQEQVFPIQDVLNIGFSEQGDSLNASSDPAPAQPPQPDPSSIASTPPPAPVPRPSPSRSIVVPAGTTVFVRMIDGVDSSQNRVGDTFRASLESALVVGDTVVAPKGAEAFGKLTQAKSAGSISGAPELTLELTGIRVGGQIVPLDSTDYDVAGKSRGSESAQRIGGAAVIGTILGAIAGGGKGAAIGGVAGAGAGTAVQVMTHGQQVRVPSETLLEFRLQQDVPAPLPGAAN